MATATWIVVADAARARIYTTDADLADWVEIRDLVHAQSRADDKELVSDMHDTATRRGPRSRPSPTVDHHELEGERFARQVAGDLRTGFDAHDYADLVLVAPPAMLGWLRAHLDGPVRDRVRVEIGKDYTRLPTADLRQHVLHQLVR